MNTVSRLSNLTGFNKPRLIFAVLFFSFQLGMIVYARFTESRYFCWAPFDAQNEYRIGVHLNGRDLTSKEIFLRYRIRAKALDSRSIQHVKNIIQQYEETYGKGEGAEVSLVYTTNGLAQEPWHWPR